MAALEVNNLVVLIREFVVAALKAPTSDLLTTQLDSTFWLNYSTIRPNNSTRLLDSITRLNYSTIKLYSPLLHQVACNKEKLVQLEKRLLQAIYLFRRRLEWLTTESRRVFGVIEERAVTIVLDIRNMSPQQFDQYRTAIERVMREQVSQLAKFNIIR